MQWTRAWILLPDQGEQRLIEKSASRHRRQAARLVDDDNLVVFVDDFEIGGHRRFVPWRPVPHQRLAGVEDGVTSYAFTVYADFATRDACCPFSFGRVTTGGGEVGQNRFANGLRTDLLPIRPALIQRQEVTSYRAN